MERTHRLPLQAVDGVAGRVRFGDDAASEFLPGVVVVALGAGEVELALLLVEGLLAGLEVGSVFAGGLDLDWHAARLAADVGGQSQKFFALVRERRGLLLLDAAGIDALLEVDELAAMQGWIAGGDPLHAG